MRAALAILAAALTTSLLTLCAPRASAQGTLRWPEPTAPPTRAIDEQGPSPLYYRIPPNIILGSLRLGLGANARVAQGGEEGGWAFALDVLGGAAVRFGRASRFGLWGELGYSYVGFSEHLVSLGVGPMAHKIGPALFSYSDEPDPPGSMTIAVIPRALLGSAFGELGVGARTGVIFALSFYGLEVAHQLLFVGARRVHEIHIAFTSAGFFGGGDE
jgi:hypothetical protein